MFPQREKLIFAAANETHLWDGKKTFFRPGKHYTWSNLFSVQAAIFSIKSSTPRSSTANGGSLLLLGFCHVVNLCFLQSNVPEKRGEPSSTHSNHNRTTWKSPNWNRSIFDLLCLLITWAEVRVAAGSPVLPLGNAARKGIRFFTCPLDSPPLFCLYCTTFLMICQ